MPSQKTFHVELRCMNVDTLEKFESLKKVAQQAARTMHAAAMLLCAGDTTPPQILLYGEDFLNGREEIEKATGAPDDGDE